MFDLSDTTFIVPFSLDSADRLRNLRITTRFLLHHFDTNIVVSEHAAESRLDTRIWTTTERRFIRHCFFRNEQPYFQRTRSVNLAVKEITTPYFVIYDSDVLLQSAQYIQAIQMLRQGDADMCLPFSNRVMWVPQEGVKLLPPVPSDDDLAALNYDISDDSYIFLGLVNFLNTRSFIEAGMMNENFKSWGYEEMELYIRLLKLGCSVLRVSGCAYHLDHYRGQDSTSEHPYYLHNQQEYHRTLACNPDDLRRQARSWHWVQNAGIPLPS
jgi:hypothetical protein